jgi:iron complex transport system substrate-binding protein
LLASTNKATLFEYFTKKWFKVMFNGDWTNNPLEKPNGFFFALYTDSIPRRIQSLAKLKRIQRYFSFSQKRHEPTVLSGAMFQDQWYVPQGDSWRLYF